MDTLWYGLKVAVVGMVVVFFGLIILIGCIKALKAVKGRGDTPPSMEKLPQQAPQVSSPADMVPTVLEPVRVYTPGPKLTRRDGAFHAVVTAAIAETLAAEGVSPEGGFAIRSIKRTDELGRKLTQKDGALYAVITGAVAQTLESEGINPDGGFAIRSVKAL